MRKILVWNSSHNYCDYHLLWAFRRATLCSNDRVAERVSALYKLLCQRAVVSSRADTERNRHGVRSAKKFKLIIIKLQARPLFWFIHVTEECGEGFCTHKKRRRWDKNGEDKWQSYEMKFILILRLSLPQSATQQQTAKLCASFFVLSSFIKGWLVEINCDMKL